MFIHCLERKGKREVLRFLSPEQRIYQQVIGLLVSTGRKHPSQHETLGPDTGRSMDVLFLHHEIQISEACFCGRQTHIA